MRCDVENKSNNNNAFLLFRETIFLFREKRTQIIGIHPTIYDFKHPIL
jgi:hypothetical protein